MLSTLPIADVLAKSDISGETVHTWPSSVAELDLEKKLAVQVLHY